MQFIARRLRITALSNVLLLLSVYVVVGFTSTGIRGIQLVPNKAQNNCFGSVYNNLFIRKKNKKVLQKKKIHPFLLLSSSESSELGFKSTLNDASTQQKEENISDPPVQIIVVGGGVGGMAVAARIASSMRKSKCQCEITVLEKNEFMGGRCGSFDVEVPGLGAFRHERGPSLLLLPDIYRNLFQDCSDTGPEAYGLHMNQCIPAYQAIFEDGDRINLGFPTSSTTTTKLGTKMTLLEKESRNKMNSLELNGARKWDEYMQAMSAYLDCGLPNFIEERLDLFSFPKFLFEALRDYGKAWPLKPHSDVLDAIFESNKMKAIASFQDLYVGLEPFRNNDQLAGGIIQSTAPAVFGLLSAIELHPSNSKSGVFAPVGGFRAVTNAFVELAKDNGVKIQYNTTVTSVHRNGVYACDSSSTSLDEEAATTSTFIPGDFIVINADLPYATKTLIPKKEEEEEEEEEPLPASVTVGNSDDENQQKQRSQDNFRRNSKKNKGNGYKCKQPKYDWDDKFDFSSGVIAFHWAIDIECNDLNTHNVFLAANSRTESEDSWRVLRTEEKKKRGSLMTNFNDCDNDDTTFEFMNFYVHRPSKTDPTAAPLGCDTILVLVPCDSLYRIEDCSTLSREESIQKYKEQFKEKVIVTAKESVLKRLAAIESLKNLQAHIVNEVVDTPVTYADRYNLAAGTPFALSHGFGQLSVTRPGPRYNLKQNKNILYCGASSRPGNGVPLVLIGAKLVAKRALSMIKIQKEEEEEQKRLKELA